MQALKENPKGNYFNTPGQLLKLFIKNIFNSLDYNISRKQKAPALIFNVFNTSNNKNVLLSYIKKVFEDATFINDRRHTNIYTTYLIADALNQLGYNVDVVDCNDDYFGDFSKYDLVIGLGKTLDQVLQFRQNSSKTKVIWFGTGCNPFFSNPMTIKRVGDSYKRNNKLMLLSSRYIKEDYPLQHEFADWIILHGSTFAKSTYRTENISAINAPVFINQSMERTDEEWEHAKRHYLWFGNGGLIHKGLDLLIDSFKGITGCNLHVCGNLEDEKMFSDYYISIINSSQNIIYHGFVDIDSDSFKEILRNCAFVIYPSASEGNSPSVITCMANGGLIPVVSKYADVNLDGYGVAIDDLSIESVISSVEQSQKLSIAELKIQSCKIITETHQWNSFDYFKKDFKQKLQKALELI